MMVVRVVVVGLRVGEGRKRHGAWAIILRPVPGVVDGSGKSANDWLALLGDGLSVGVLVAHHDESLAVDGELVVELTISGLEVVDAAIESVESISVFSDGLSVPGDLLVVVVDGGVVLADLSAGVVDAVLEAGDGLADGLSADEHVAGLGNLELVSVLTEESTVGIESIDSRVEIGSSGVSWRGSAVATVVLMAVIVVVVMIVQFVVGVLAGIVVVTGNGGSSDKGSGNNSHCLQLSLFY